MLAEQDNLERSHFPDGFCFLRGEMGGLAFQLAVQKIVLVGVEQGILVQQDDCCVIDGPEPFLGCGERRDMDGAGVQGEQIMRVVAYVGCGIQDEVDFVGGQGSHHGLRREVVVAVKRQVVVLLEGFQCIIGLPVFKQADGGALQGAKVVWVESVDLKRQRIQLTMLDPK